MERIQKALNILTWVLIICLGCYILYRSKSLVQESSVTYSFTGLTSELENRLTNQAIETHLPGLMFPLTTQEDFDLGEYIMEQCFRITPIYQFVMDQVSYETEAENASTYEMILASEASDENEVDELTGQVINGTDEALMEAENAQNIANNENAEAASAEAGVVYSLDKLSDYDFLINNLYTIDKTTTITSAELNAAALLAKDMTMQADSSAPQILIYHTHSQEAFADSVSGDTSTTIVGVGAYLTELLEGYGYNVIHHQGVYDMVDGGIERNKAYTLAEDAIREILEENPSIEVVIDMHRDGVRDGVHLVTDVNGKQTAQFMFFNGLSRTTQNGDISYLPNPYIEDNLSFSLQMQLMADKYYSGVTRKIYLKGYRYNMHLAPKMLLVEVGAQTNTVAEVKNAMEPLSDVLHRVLSGEEY